MRKIIIALPKGKRLLSKAYGIFQKMGYSSKALEQEIEEQKGKQLEFESDNKKVVFLLVRIADIPQYIDKNWAEIGVTAFDCYREYELAGLTLRNSLNGNGFISDLLPDIKLCEKSRFCIAGAKEKREFYEKCKTSNEKILEVATQYPNIAAKYFQSKGIIADIITVTGSAELMPKHGGVDVVFDIVETGSALKENGLEIFEEAMPVQTKILVNKAAIKYDENVRKFIEEAKNEIR